MGILEKPSHRQFTNNDHQMYDINSLLLGQIYITVHSYDLANFLFVAPYLNIFQYDCQGDVILNLVGKKFSIPNSMTYIKVKSNFEALWVKKWLKKFVGPTVTELWATLCFWCIRKVSISSI